MVTDDDFPTAAVSRARATGVTSKAVKSVMTSVRMSIQEAIAGGRTECTHSTSGAAWTYEIRTTVAQLLRDKGYQVYLGDDQREGSWMTVKW